MTKVSELYFLHHARIHEWQRIHHAPIELTTLPVPKKNQIPPRVSSKRRCWYMHESEHTAEFWRVHQLLKTTLFFRVPCGRMAGLFNDLWNGLTGFCNATCLSSTHTPLFHLSYSRFRRRWHHFATHPETIRGSAQIIAHVRFSR